jgi:hypothetical protein
MAMAAPHIQRSASFLSPLSTGTGWARVTWCVLCLALPLVNFAMMSLEWRFHAQTAQTHCCFGAIHHPPHKTLVAAIGSRRCTRDSASASATCACRTQCRCWENECEVTLDMRYERGNTAQDIAFEITRMAVRNFRRSFHCFLDTCQSREANERRKKTRGGARKS